MPNKLQQAVEAAGHVFGIRTEEQPKHKVVERIGAVEIRRYQSRLAAETTVELKNENEARDKAFSLLAGYIFGGNRDKRDIAMTAPVVNEKASRQIAMTAPVETTQEAKTFSMRFFLPAEITSANAPAPLDQNVRIVEIPEELIATLGFSGSWQGSHIAEKEAELLTALKNSPWKPIGRPFAQLYDPPFALPFLRKNEVAVRVAKADG